MRNSPVTRTEFDLLVDEIRDLRGRVLRQENQHEPTVPLYPVDFPDDPIQGQIALAPGSFPTVAATLVRRTGAGAVYQPISVNTLTTIAFTSIDYEYQEWIHLGIDATILTVPEDGFYVAEGGVRWETVAAGGTRRGVWINYNGSLEAGNEYANVAALPTDMQVTFSREMSAGDVLTLDVLQASAGSRDIWLAHLSVTRVWQAQP